MSIQKIEYENKIGLQNDENVPNKNKVTDDDMNEIKETVNNNADELTTAQQNIKGLQSDQSTASGDITSLKNRVTALETDNTTNKQDINTLKTDNETNKSNIATLQTDNETNKTNISTLQEDVGEIEGNIQQIQQEQTAQNKKIEELDDNQIHVTTEKANNINIKDASGQNGKIKLFGISRQEGTPSPENIVEIENTGDNINLFNKETVENNTYVNATTGQVQSYTGASSSDYIDIKGLKAIILSGDNIVRSNGGAFYNAEKQYISGFTTPQIWNGIQVPENANYVRVTVTTTELDVVKIEKGTKATGYSKYKCGSVEITDCNENLFNIDEFKDFFNLTETGTDEGHNYVAYTTNAYENNKFMQGKFKENTQYTISFLGRQKQVGQGQTSGFVFNYTDGTNSIKYVNNNVTWTKYTLTSDKNKTIDYISMAWAYGGTIWLSDIQLEVNNVTTDYAENEQQLITFPLQENQKMYKGSETEDDGIHHKRKQIELDGTENWVADNQAGSDTCVGWKILVDDYVGHEGNFAPHGDILCSHFIDRNTYNNELDGISGGWGKWIYIKIKKEDLSTPDLTGFKSFLAEQKTNGTPVTIEYPLAEETIEAYATEQQEADNQLQNAKTYKTVTNVFTENAELEMEYIADTKTYIDNETNSIKEELNTIKELLSTTTTSAMLLDNMQTDLESEVL